MGRVIAFTPRLTTPSTKKHRVTEAQLRQQAQRDAAERKRVEVERLIRDCDARIPAARSQDERRMLISSRKALMERLQTMECSEGGAA